MEYSQQKYDIDMKSKVTERNSIMLLDSITYDGGVYSQTCSVLKDNVQYSFVYSYHLLKDERGYFYDLIDSVEFD